MRRWRAFHPDVPTTPGASVTLGTQEAHHLIRVLRLTVGDVVELFDGRSAVWATTVEEISATSATVRLERRIETSVEPPVKLRLFQGLCRADKMDGIVQKMTEVGAAAIHPLGCRNAERFPPNAKRLDRWRRIAIESCKQSGRHIVPLIEPLERLPSAQAGELALLLAPGAPPLAAALEQAVDAELWLAVGPESGFTEEEAAAAESTGWRLVSLGPRILRTEGAGFAAASILLHRLGDLGR